MIHITCAGCLNKFEINQTQFYRKKRWCGSTDCKEVIDDKIKNRNYKRQQKKIEKGTWRKGVDINLKALILERDTNMCVRCGHNEIRELQIHHIVPVSYGGKDDIYNLITLCKSCHDYIHKSGVLSFVNTLVDIAAYRNDEIRSKMIEEYDHITWIQVVFNSLSEKKYELSTEDLRQILIATGERFLEFSDEEKKDIFVFLLGRAVNYSFEEKDK
jgi:5-methylcytosine-specific restriction endonuclease McrA